MTDVTAPESATSPAPAPTPAMLRTRKHHRASMIVLAVVAVLFAALDAWVALPLFVRAFFFAALLGAGFYFMGSTMMVMVRKSDVLEEPA